MIKREMYYHWPTDISAQKHSDSFALMLHNTHRTEPRLNTLFLKQKLQAQFSPPQILLEKVLLQRNYF